MNAPVGRERAAVRRKRTATALINLAINVSSRQLSRGESSIPDLFQAKLAVVTPDDPVALAGAVFELLALHDPHRTTSVLDDLLLL
jgi:hypothetical protein